MTAIRISVVFGLALTIAIANAVRVVSDEPVTVQLLYAAETLFVLLPFAAGICVASLRSPTRRSALLIAGVTSLTMIGIDLLPTSDEPWHHGRVAQRMDTGQWVKTRLLSRWNAVSGISTVYGHLAGHIEFFNEPDGWYESGSPRWNIASGYTKIVFFALPVAVVGLVLGMLRALRRAILFKSRGVELAADFIVGWGGTLLIVWFLQEYTYNLQSRILRDSLDPGFLPVPMVVALLISLIGWLPAREIE